MLVELEKVFSCLSRIYETSNLSEVQAVFFGETLDSLSDVIEEIRSESKTQSTIHYDAFKAANGYAGRIVNFSEAMEKVQTELEAKQILEKLQLDYARIFETFMEGVKYGRTQGSSGK